MDDASDLRERVRDLEQTVSDQQATIEQLRDRGVSRRGVLAGGAGLGAIGLGVLGSQSATAQSAAGQVGTESEPVDVEAATLNAGAVNAGQIAVDNVAGQLEWVSTQSDQTIPSASSETIEWGTASIEDQDIATVDVANDEIIVSAPGTYLITGYATWASDSGWSTGESARINPAINGTTNAFPQHLKTSTDSQSFDFTIVKKLTNGDSVSVVVRQLSGSDKNLFQSAGPGFGQFSVVRLG